ncbi:MAG: hypothetical protein V4496_06765 [Pseudomonadota bacterium]
MKVLCKKIYNSTTGEDMGSHDSWRLASKEYIVLMMSYSKHNGIYITFQTENYGDPARFHLKGFEFISDYIPSSWITDVEIGSDGTKYINMLPASWNYESFFDDLEDEEEIAMKLFHEEAQKIYEEEECYKASLKK